MLFGDTDAQGLACDVSISFRDNALIATSLCAEQWQCSFILDLKEMVEEKQVSSVYCYKTGEDVDWSQETAGWGAAFSLQLTRWLVQRLKLGQVLLKFKDSRVPGKPRTKDTNSFAANFSLHCGALKTLTPLELHKQRCQGDDQLGQRVAAQVNYSNLFCLSLSVNTWQHIQVFLDAAATVGL